jgi:hypothetical protein
MHTSFTLYVSDESDETKAITRVAREMPGEFQPYSGLFRAVSASRTGGVLVPIVDAVKVCLTKYADFNGRATRTEYWWFFLAVLLGSAAASLITLRVYTLFSLATLLPMVAVGARRLHDTNRSGWWQLLALVPFGVILVIIFLAQRSTLLNPAELSAGTQP